MRLPSRRHGVRGTHTRPWLVGGLLLLCGFLALVTFRPTHVSAQATPDEQLVARYAPTLMLKRQAHLCDTEGEPYLPAPIEVIYSDPAVQLRTATDGGRRSDPVITGAPGARDLAGAAEDSYLDFPGNPRDPGCTYEQHARQRMNGLQPTIYARIAIDNEEAKLALQYWFYYYFNDFNNNHESDWEMIQLVFDAASVEQALTQAPEVIGYAQHGGGELAGWDDAKLQRQGDHPIVYVSAGSHASQFGSETYIGWGEGGTGFGCDDTTGPSVVVTPQVVIVPPRPDADDPLAWALFQGRWGERQPWEFNGPKGPNLGKKWDDPIGAISDWRPASLSVPAEETLGPTATDAFCDITAFAAGLLISVGVSPVRTALLALAAVTIPLLLLYLVRHLLGRAAAIYRVHWRLLGGIGLFAIPIGMIFNGLVVTLSDNPPLEWIIQIFNGSAFGRLVATLAVGFIQQAAMLIFVTPAIISALVELRAGRSTSVLKSYRTALRHLLPLSIALLILAAVTTGIGLTAVGLPLALIVAVCGQFFAHAVLVDGVRTGGAALVQSTAAVRRHWPSALVSFFAFQLIVAMPGPVIGIILLILGGASVHFANGISSLVYAVTVPVSAIALLLVYLRLTNRPVQFLE